MTGGADSASQDSPALATSESIEVAPRRWLRGRRVLGSVSMATRIPAAVVGISLLSLVVATLVGLAAGSDLDRELTDDGHACAPGGWGS